MKIRTHTCGELKSKDCKKSVILNGWVNTVRLHGQVVFIDLRDRYGKTQIVFNSENYVGDFNEVKKLSMEVKKPKRKRKSTSKSKIVLVKPYLLNHQRNPNQ